MKKYVILAAGGSGTRMHAGENKIFLRVGTCTVLCRSILLFDGIIDGMVIVSKPDEIKRAEAIAESSGVSYRIKVVAGGSTRQQSVMNGLNALQAEAEDIVMVHDAARCMTPRDVILSAIESCRCYGSGVPGIPAVSTMKYSDAYNYVKKTVDRNGLYEIQTPQVFYYGKLMNAYRKAEESLFNATDDASVMEFAGESVHLVQGSRTNIKATEKEDLLIMNAMVNREFPVYRIGMGYDVHRLAENRKLILCGIEIPYSLGLLGHSDADVALHALMDAMLGAAALGDIGTHFPDTSDEYEGISSLVLLKKTFEIVQNAGYNLVNADLTIAAQKPKLAGYIPSMIRKISDTIQCLPSQVSVKATTTEKLGFEGRGEGISAQAVCLLAKKNQ